MLLAAVAPLLSHCAASGERTQAFEEPADASLTEPADDAGATQTGSFVEAGVDTGVGQGTTCKRTLTMGKITSSTNPSCYINEQVSNREEDLEYDCKTGGKATITFGKQVFEGKVKGDSVDLTNVEAFVFGGCQWESTQRIFGDLSTKKVGYSYAEKPLQSCPNQYPCSAEASFSVSASDEVVVR